MADPDEALVEAIEAAIDNATDSPACPYSGEQHGCHCNTCAAHAAYAAMVAHLGLAEEWAATDTTSVELGMYPSDEFAHTDRAATMARFVGDGDDVLLRRLTTRWVEVDHGSE